MRGLAPALVFLGFIYEYSQDDRQVCVWVSGVVLVAYVFCILLGV